MNAADANPGQPALSGDVPRDLSVPKPGVTILLVEDDPQVRELTRTMLRGLGYRVLWADSAAQALEVWERHRQEIDLLITDMMIPNCATGSELARRFQSEKPRLRVLLTSGFGKEIGQGDTAFVQKSLFLQKPYTQASLMQMVAACLKEDGLLKPG